MAQEHPDFPILCIARSGFLIEASDRDALEICGQSALGSGYFEGMLLIDTLGRSWDVRSATKVANVGWLGGWRFLQSRRIRVALELVEGRLLGLPELQDLVSQAIDRFPPQWEEIEEAADTEARVRATGTIREIIDLFGGQSKI